MSDLPSPSLPTCSPPLRPLTPNPLEQPLADDEPPAKRLRTEAQPAYPLSPSSPLPLSSLPPPFSAHLSSPPPLSDLPLIVPQPVVAVSVSTLSSPPTSPPPPLPQPRPPRHRSHRHRRRPSSDAVDVDYQPVAGDDADDDVTLLLDDLQRVEGEEEEELLDLQRDADIDIEELRRRLRADDAGEEDEGEEGEDGEEDGEDGEGDSAYSSDEDSVDVNDLPRLKDLQLLRVEAVTRGLPEPTSLLNAASLNVPFPPKPRAAQVSPLPPVEETPHSAPLLASQPPEPPVLPPVPAVPAVAAVEEPLELEEEQASDAPLDTAVGAVVTPAPGDATERELMLSRELGLTVEEMRAADRAYDDERRREDDEEAERLQRRRDERRTERQRRPVRDAADGDRPADDGYLSSSSSSAESQDGESSEGSDDSDDGSRSLSPYSAAFYTSSHSFYPAKSSRVGPLYQPDELPDVIGDVEQRLMECERNRRLEGDRVDVQWELEPPVESLYWQVEARRAKVREERAAREAALAAVEEGQGLVVEEGGQVAEVVVHQPAVRSQRSSAKRAREYIATVAEAEGVDPAAREGEGVEADGLAGAAESAMQEVQAEAVSVYVLT